MVEALLLGSIGILAETSEIQRKAYNQSFEEHGLDWYWNIANYCEMLKQPGGKKRLVDFGNGQIPSDMVDSIHHRKEELFEAELQKGLTPRRGVVECIHACKDRGLKIGFVTTTSQNNIDALSDALAEHLDFNLFDLITTKQDVATAKPDSAIYHYALSHLGITADKTIAVEDTEANQQAAMEQQILCYLFAGEYARTVHNFNAVKSLEAISNRF